MVVITSPTSMMYHTAEDQRTIKTLLVTAAFCILNVYLRGSPRRRLQRQHVAPMAPVQPRRRPPRNRIWCREWLMRRPIHGDYHQLLQELHAQDSSGFRNYLRIQPQFFQDMVERLSPRLQKKVTRMRHPVSVGCKLAVTLRFLATGNSYTSLQYSFRVSKSAISKFVPEVCSAIIDVYGPEVMKCPNTPDAWKEVANGFSRKWNYHNCCGALDGKHVRIKKPVGGGSLFFNYKKFHSIVLMALADAQYKFLYVDVGAEGGAGDGGTWYKCSLNAAIEQKRAGIPEDSPMPNDDTPMPFHVIADDAFALKPWLMKPYSHQSQVHHERIYSYRLSRARRVVEYAFGILQTRWRVFSSAMEQSPQRVKIITMGACVLHNLILSHTPMALHEVDYEDRQHHMVPGAWRDQHVNMEGLYVRGQNATTEAKAVRNYLASYYCSEAGEVPWQEMIVYPRGRQHD